MEEGFPSVGFFRKLRIARDRAWRLYRVPSCSSMHCLPCLVAAVSTFICQLILRLWVGKVKGSGSLMMCVQEHKRSVVQPASAKREFIRA